MSCSIVLFGFIFLYILLHISPDNRYIEVQDEFYQYLATPLLGFFLSAMSSFGFPFLIKRLPLPPRSNLLLLTFIRTLNVFFFPVVCAIWLSSNCLNGWRKFWTLCSISGYWSIRIDYNLYALRDSDICDMSFEWHSNNCMREVFRLLMELNVAKMVSNMILSFVIFLYAWAKEHGKLPWQRFGYGTNRSLQKTIGKEFASLLMLVDYFLIWGGILPILSIMAYCAVVNHSFVFTHYLEMGYERQHCDYAHAVKLLYFSIFISQVMISMFLYPQKHSGLPSFMFFTYVSMIAMHWAYTFYDWKIFREKPSKKPLTSINC